MSLPEEKDDEVKPARLTKPGEEEVSKEYLSSRLGEGFKNSIDTAFGIKPKSSTPSTPSTPKTEPPTPTGGKRRTRRKTHRRRKTNKRKRRTKHLW
jgi:hypothetical protein